jgi:hypothetical protein
MRPSGSIACLTSNVARALARMGWAHDERVVAALRSVAKLYDELGVVDCRLAQGYQLNGYCHMLAAKELLFLAEIPADLWPDGAERLREACVAHMRAREVFRYLPAEAREFNASRTAMRAGDHNAYREQFLAEHPGLHFEEKPGWTRFGYPLSYNSDALEALWAVAQAGEPPGAEYCPAVELVRHAADTNMRWTLRNSLDGKMLADVETKGRPSKWLTLRALQVLEWAQG